MDIRGVEDGIYFFRIGLDDGRVINYPICLQGN